VASHTISGQAWPDGTTVGVYPAVAVPAGSDVPSGLPTATGVVSGGSVTFAGLAEKVRYYAYAAGVGRFLLVSSTLKEGDRARIETLESEVGSAPASRLDSVEVGLGRVTTALTDGSDATAALRNDHAAALLLGTHVLLTPGTYRVSGRIHSAGATTDPVRFVAAVPGTVTIERTANTPIIEVTGSRSATVALTANVAAGDSSLTVASLPTSLAAGDYVAVRSSTLLTPTGLAKLAEVMQVQSITGTGPYTINFYGTFEEAYTTAATALVERLAFAGAGSLLRGIKFRQTAVNRDTSGNPLVRFDVARAGLIAACEFNDADAPGVELRHCFDFDIESPKFSNLTDDLANDRIGYGVNLHGNCRDILITKPRARWVRHAVTTNGDDFGAPRHVLVTNGQGYESSGGSWNTHKEGKFITFAFCESHNDKGTGFFIRSPYTALIEPRVIRPGGDGIAYAQSECDNGHVVGGYALGSGGSGFYPLNLSGRNIKVDGTFVEGAASGQPNVKCFALEAKFHNLHSRNPGTSVHIDFPSGAGSDGVVQGGWFQSTSTAAIVGVASGVTVRLKGTDGSSVNGPGFSGAGTVMFEGSFRGKRVMERLAKATSYAMQSFDPGLLAVTDTSAVRTITLPAANAWPPGSELLVKDEGGSAGTNNITIQRAGTDTLDGGTSTTIAANYGTKRFYTDGSTKWFSV
jgi:hypothetical protein